MKKIYSLLIALLCSATMAFAYNAQIDGIYYDFDYENTTATVTSDWNIWDDNGAGYTQSEIIIPEKVTYNGVEYTVTEIGIGAFYGCSSLTSITIPNNVTSIEGAAFSGCSSLTSITIPNSVTSIGYNAFINCSSLTLITIPNSVTLIGNYAFSGCSSLTSITIPNSVTSIGNYAFEGCSSLTSITIPNSVTSIRSFAFSGCSSLTSITIPNSVTEIGSSAFYGCSLLTSIEIPNSVTTIGDGAFLGCISLTSITIPNSVTSIGEYAFCGCSSLTSIIIPNSVTLIGNYAFSGCSSLTSITIPNSVTSIRCSAFYGCSSLASIDVETNNQNYASIDGVLYNKEITILICCPGGKTSITIPNSVTSIGEYAFDYCQSLTSITIPNSVTSIGKEAFRDCTSLISITISNSVTEIGYEAFSGTLWLENQSDGCVYINNYLYTYKGEMSANTHIDVKEGTTQICNYAFSNCSSLTSIIIPNSVTSIGNRAFYGCSSLTSVTIGNSVTEIGSYAFYGCQSLTSITIQAENPFTIGEYTFENVPRSIQIKVPCGSKAKYQIVAYWKEFLNYEEVPVATLSVDVNDKAMGFATVTKPNSCTDDVAQVQAQALAGYEFVRWSDGATENPHILLVTEDMTITAEFRKIGEEPEDKPGEDEKHNNFIVESADETQGTVKVMIVAEAIEGFEFDHWSDGSTENPRIVTLDADVELYAYFKASTDVENSRITSAVVYSNNGVLHVEGAETDYHVLDAAGRLVYSGSVAALALPRGVYVVVVEGETQKVVL